MMERVSKIVESLWKGVIDRSKSDSERIEDKRNTNIDELNPIDLGLSFLIADVDFYDEELKTLFRESDINYGGLNQYFKRHGWRLPTVDEITQIQTAVKKDKIKVYSQHNSEKKYNKKLIFHDNSDTFLNFDVYDEKYVQGGKMYALENNNIICVLTLMDPDWHDGKFCEIHKGELNPTRNVYIRLVKDR
jgi:hypothetical protein